jgi:hypothetical protein
MTAVWMYLFSVQFGGDNQVTTGIMQVTFGIYTYISVTEHCKPASTNMAITRKFLVMSKKIT